jgi:hypothetical protein
MTVDRSWSPPPLPERGSQSKRLWERVSIKPQFEVAAARSARCERQKQCFLFIHFSAKLEPIECQKTSIAA